MAAGAAPGEAGWRRSIYRDGAERPVAAGVDPPGRVAGIPYPCAPAGRQQRHAGRPSGLGVTLPFDTSGHVEDWQALCSPILEAGRAKFWFHCLRNAFITEAERELILPRSPTKRLVNHARPGDVTEGCAADWTVEELREPAQQIANRIDELPEGSESSKAYAVDSARKLDASRNT